MAQFLNPDLTTIAFCWRVERRDGVAIGNTTHDRELAIDGLIYRAAPGMLPSAITLSDGFDRPLCSTGRSWSRRRPSAGRSSATRGAAWTWRDGCG
jgi:hypothetical protein